MYPYSFIFFLSVCQLLTIVSVSFTPEKYIFLFISIYFYSFILACLRKEHQIGSLSYEAQWISMSLFETSQSNHLIETPNDKRVGTPKSDSTGNAYGKEVGCER